MKAKDIVPLLTRSFNDWNKNNAPRLGAALALYTLLSISPLVVLVVSILSLVFSRSSAQAQLLGQVQGVIGSDGREAVQSMLTSGTSHPASGILATVLSLATLLFGASSVFNELRSALNTIWEAKPKEENGVWGWLRERFFSLGMVLSVGFLLMVSLLVSAGLAAVGKFAGQALPVPEGALHAFNFGLSLAVTAALLALLFKYVPEAEVHWSDVRAGAVFTALLFTLGKTLLGFYLGKASPGSAYGAAGSLVVTIIWVYYSAQIFYFGAEFTHVYAESKRGGAASLK